MLPGTGYFKALNCPFYEMGYCERPYCHFKHIKKDVTVNSATVKTPPAAEKVPAVSPTVNTSPTKESLPVTQQPQKVVVKQEPVEEDLLTNFQPNPGTSDSIQPSSPALDPLPPDKDIPALASNPLLTAAGSQASLEQLVQDAVKKVLLGEGGSGLLKSVDTASILAQIVQTTVQVKQEAPEDDDSDCVIEEVIPAPNNQPAMAKIKSEQQQRPLDLPMPPITQEEQEDDIKPKFYLPPVDSPVYNPTPIKDLQKKVVKANISPGLTQASSSAKSPQSKATVKVRNKKQKFSYKPENTNADKGGVFGDLNDLTDSDNDNSSTPDVLGDILKEGNKSGVLVGGVVSEFEERVIKEKLKLFRKKSDKSDQCDMITSSSPTQEEASDEIAEVKDCLQVVQEETEEEKVERKFREKEEEIRKLEEKRLILENFYKAKVNEKKIKDKELSKQTKDGTKGSKTDKGKSKNTGVAKEKYKLKKESRNSSRQKKKVKKRKYSTGTDDSEDSSDEDDSSYTDDDSDDKIKNSKLKKRDRERHRSKSKHKQKTSKHKHHKDIKNKKRKRSASKSRKKTKKRTRERSTDSSSENSSRETLPRKGDLGLKVKKKQSKGCDEDSIVINLDEDDLNTENIVAVPNVKSEIFTQIKEEPSIDNSITSIFHQEPTGDIDSNFFKLCGLENEAKDLDEEQSSGLSTLRVRNFSELVENDSACGSNDLTNKEEEDSSFRKVTEDFQPVDDNEDIRPDKDEDYFEPNKNDETFEPDLSGKSFLTAMSEFDGKSPSDIKSEKSRESSSRKEDDKRSGSSSKHKSSSSKSGSASKLKSSSSKSHHSKSSHSSGSSRHKSSSDHKSSSHHKSSSQHKSSSDQNYKSSSKSNSDHKSNSTTKSSNEHKSSSDLKTKSDHKSYSDHKTKTDNKSRSEHEIKSDHKSLSHNRSSSDYKSSKNEYSSSKHEPKSNNSNQLMSNNSVKEDFFIEDSEQYDREDSKSPIPDFSEELSLLPDEINDAFDTVGDDYDTVADGLEDIFAGVGEDDELQKIFDEYQEETPEEAASEASLKKAKQLEERLAAAVSKSDKSQTMIGKKRVAYSGADDNQEHRRPLHMKKPAIRTPAQAMYDRYKKIQAIRQQKLIEQKLTDLRTDTTDDTEVQETSVSLGSGKVRVAHKLGPVGRPPVLSKTKQQLEARKTQMTNSDSSNTDQMTVAVTNTKGVARKAHAPSSAAVAKVASCPMVAPDPHSKVPTNIRQRYLNSIIEECMKISGGDELEAWERAEKEEKDCCRKASSRMIYLNLVVNCIKKLRTEASQVASRGNKKYGESSKQSRSMLTTHMQVLAGKPGSVGTWSIEKSNASITTEEIDETLMYKVMEKYSLTEEQLVDNGYPRPDPAETGRAVMKVDIRRKVDPEKAKQVESNEDLRLCARCSTVYRVNKEELQVEKENCVHHWGRCFRRRGNKATGPASQWNCCEGAADSDGCHVAKAHVTETLDYNNMRGFVSTLDKGGEGKVFALDCEMCNTTKGNELTRVTVIDYTGTTCYESLVLPDNPIVDFNTRFSGITSTDMLGLTTSIRDVQAHLLLKFDANDILIGHSLESDMKALKMLHGTVVDTSVVFPHKMGPPFKRGLKVLTQEYIRRIIQCDDGGHDSKEDALACLDLMKMKVTNDVRKGQSKLGQISRRRDAYLTDPDKVVLN